MTKTIHVKFYDALRDSGIFDEKQAKNIAASFTETMQEEIAEAKKQYATNDFVKAEIVNAKNELSRQIYIVGLIQFVAIIASLIGILSFMLSNSKH